MPILIPPIRPAARSATSSRAAANSCISRACTHSPAATASRESSCWNFPRTARSGPRSTRSPRASARACNRSCNDRAPGDGTTRWPISCGATKSGSASGSGAPSGWFSPARPDSRSRTSCARATSRITSPVSSRATRPNGGPARWLGWRPFARACAATRTANGLSKSRPRRCRRRARSREPWARSSSFSCRALAPSCGRCCWSSCRCRCGSPGPRAGSSLRCRDGATCSSIGRRCR